MAVHNRCHAAPRAQQHAEGREDAERFARDAARRMRPFSRTPRAVPFRHPVTGAWCERR